MTSAYKPGSVTSTLFPKSKKSVKNDQNQALANLFGETILPPKIIQKVDLNGTKEIKSGVKRKKDTTKSNQPVDDDTDIPRKKKKKVSKDTEEGRLKSQTSVHNDFPYIHESLLSSKNANIKKPKQVGSKNKISNEERKKEDRLDELALERPRRNRKRDKKADNRTIFVGNCPLSADKKVLKRLFQEYGDIETIRFRCAPAAELKVPKRAIVIKKDFHEKAKSFISFIVFKEEISAKKALEKNGFELDGNHLRVDKSSGSDKVDKKRSIFIGNLAFDITEEDIRGHVADCGTIVNVRVVRDRETSIGKGFCFVEFESKDSVGLALKLNNMELEGRKLRISACLSKAKQEKKKAPKSEKKDKKISSNEDGKKKMSFAPSNLKTTMSTFNLAIKAKKERRLKKVKKKTHAKKNDQVTKILGPAPVVPKMDKKDKKGKVNKSAKGGSKKFKVKRLNQPFKENKGKHTKFD